MNQGSLKSRLHILYLRQLFWKICSFYDNLVRRDLFWQIVQVWMAEWYSQFTWKSWCICVIKYSIVCPSWSVKRALYDLGLVFFIQDIRKPTVLSIRLQLEEMRFLPLWFNNTNIIKYYRLTFVDKELTVEHRPVRTILVNCHLRRAGNCEFVPVHSVKYRY